MIRRRRGLLLAGAVAFLITLIALIPARFVWHLAEVPGVQVSGISGTVWRGSAREASINGVYVRNVTWVAKPAKLLLARLSYALSLEPPNGIASTQLTASIGGNVALQDLRASLPANLFSPLLGLRPMGGVINLDFSQLEIAEGIVAAADGQIRTSELRISEVSSAALGAFNAEISTQDDGVHAAIEDTDAVIDLAAQFHLRDDRSWILSGFVVETATTPSNVRQAMQFLGSPNERGQRELRLEGTL